VLGMDNDGTGGYGNSVCHAVNKAMCSRTVLHAPPTPNSVGADLGAGSDAKHIILAESSEIAPTKA